MSTTDKGHVPVGDGVEGSPTIFTPRRFAGKRVVVTGAAQGIGYAVAKRLAYEDASLLLVDRADLVLDVRSELESVGAGEVTAITADLETYAGAEAVAAAARTELGGADTLINNVGGTIWAKPFEEYSPEEITKEIDRSLFPTLWVTRAVLPVLIQNGSGTIVNVSSCATRGVNRVPYAAAKGGVNGIVSALAKEAAPHNIRVVATAPGGTLAPERKVKRGPSPEDEQQKQWYQQIVDQTIESTVMGRYGTLEEQAAPICFLASDEASYITGSVLPVAGGDQG
ncbi:1,6-dihydroxycyclohexa-2,4-diene-1-carboxylate dehydrogenase [Corynebacterium sp. H128]|uniref:1,6-dihydroxycyclohexa-2,4-diene-1-carboxylate dehydrogenase n=1 Tax=unclassified Corynebacterium TaxID=2624378 RepID=UPI0030AC501A